MAFLTNTLKRALWLTDLKSEGCPALACAVLQELHRLEALVNSYPTSLVEDEDKMGCEWLSPWFA
jgi:hypothetical protein